MSFKVGNDQQKVGANSSNFGLTAQQKEHYTRVGLAAAALIIAIGVVVGCYFCIKTTHTVSFSGGGTSGTPRIPIEPYQVSNGVLAIPTVLFGGLFIIILLGIANSNFDYDDDLGAVNHSVQ